MSFEEPQCGRKSMPEKAEGIKMAIEHWVPIANPYPGPHGNSPRAIVDPDRHIYPGQIDHGVIALIGKPQAALPKLWNCGSDIVWRVLAVKYPDGYLMEFLDKNVCVCRHRIQVGD
jgi:hypothetical protein